MTGRIRALSGEHGSGLIRGEDGANIPFDLGAVIEYDVACLAVGQVVTFDLLERGAGRAVNVCVQKEHQRAHAGEKRREPAQVRYVGFEQRDSMRTYRFEQLEAGQDASTFAITVDLALFAKHHVGIQDGPALCLHLIAEEMGRSGGPLGAQWNRCLSDADMLAHLASRPAPKERPRPRRFPHARAASA